MYRIVPKRDFPRSYGTHGFFTNGKWVNKGYVVTDGVCNIMPGATWFETVEEAMTAIHILCGVWGNGSDFWKEYKTRKS